MPWDLRRDGRTRTTTTSTFDGVVGTIGDCFDRYVIRLIEIKESCRIIRQCLDAMPTGDYRIQDKKVTPPPPCRIDESMEALIHHFKIFTEGFKVPEGEAYMAIESPRGEAGLLHRLRRVGAKPYRMHIRRVLREPPDPAAHDARRPIADAVAVISTVDPIMGEVDR